MKEENYAEVTKVVVDDYEYAISTKALKEFLEGKIKKGLSAKHLVAEKSIFFINTRNGDIDCIKYMKPK